MSLILPHNFKPRFYQLPILQALDSGIRRAVFVCHRRGGKDITLINWVIKKLAFEPQTCFYIFPSYAQAKKAIWDAINNDGQRIIEYIPECLIAQKNSQEMKIRFTNGSLLQFVGSDNADSLRGTNPKIVVFSEYAIQTPIAWDIIRPILTVNKGYAIFIGTPSGRNHFWELYRMAQGNKDWFCQLLSYKDTHVLTDEDVEQERIAGMSEEMISQEYLCSWERGIEGSYYSKLVTKMRDEERICILPYDEYKLVFTSWDLGWDDSTAVIFFQIDSGGNIKIIDYEEQSGTTLAQWKKILVSKGYTYGTHLFPHDVETIDGLSTGCTRREILEDLNISVTTVPRGLIADGIESVKALMSSRLFIHSKCDKLIKALENYHRDWDDKHKVYSNKPRHDWSSHSADALRGLAMGLSLLDQNKGTIENDYKALQKYWGS